jgi:chromosome segregation ATPase
MNAKRWFAWVCLALMLVAEIFLFRSNHERDAALSDLKNSQTQLQDTQKELDALKNSSAGAQAAELAGLRKQNEVLAAKVSALQKNVDRLQMESQQNAQHLTTARSALELQQEHLRQLQAEQQQAAGVNACINNLRMLDAAKQQWALEKNKTATDVPTAQDLLPYFKDNLFPTCPDGGTYTLNSLGELPTCTVPGHVLPAQ